MLRFRYRGIVPPGGRYHGTAGGMAFSHPERGQLIRQLENYYIQNNLSIPLDLNAQIEDCTCRQVPEKFCEGTNDGEPRKRVVTLQDIRDATLRFTGGEGFADAGTALDRAVVCVRCKLNNRAACPTCTGLAAWGTRRVGGREVTGYSDILGVCELDACLMSAGVFARTASIVEGQPDNCWRGKT